METAALIVLYALILVPVILLGSVPGRVARSRGNHSAAAISILGWLGLFTLGILWVAAIIWAYSGQDTSKHLPCPHCGELIVPSARICRYCHGQVSFAPKQFIVHGVGLDGARTQARVFALDAAQAQKKVAKQFLSLDGAVPA